MSCPPLPNDPDDLLDPNGDYLEVEFNSLVEGSVYIFYNQWTNEMMCVHILFINDFGPNDIQIVYRIFDDDGNHNMETLTIDRDEWVASQLRAFRRVKQALQPVERSVIPGRSMIGKRGAGRTKRRRQKKSKKTRKSKNRKKKP
jgi:hypothetical protein